MLAVSAPSATCRRRPAKDAGVEQDTPPTQLRRYHELLRKMTPSDRLKKASAMSVDVRALALAGIRQRYPIASEAEIRARLTVRLYGRSVAKRLCGNVPDDAR
jgi:hypothetical protein